jgi:hypothetical protein
MQWQPIPIVGGSYRDETLPWSSQDTVNMLPVGVPPNPLGYLSIYEFGQSPTPFAAKEGGARSMSKLLTAPGLTLFADTGTNAPIRGLHDAEGQLFAVAGNSLFSVSPTGVTANLGSIPGVSRVSMAHNQIAGGYQLCIAANNAGYVYDTTKSALAQITSEGFPGTISFDYLNQFITGIDPTRNFAFTSQLADAMDYNTLDRVQAESQPDLLVGQATTHGEWWLFGARTIQPFQDTGDNTGTFQAVMGEIADVGCAAGATIRKMVDTVLWLGNDGVVYMADGYSPKRISTYPVEQAIRQCNMAGAYAFTFEDRGHKIYYITFPDGFTWGVDVANNEWHRRQSYGMNRWRVSDIAYSNFNWIAGDYSNGKLYKLDWSNQSEDGQTLERHRTMQIMHNDQNPVIMAGLEVVVDTGEPASVATNMDVRYSTDGAHNWSDWRKMNMGSTGGFRQRLQMRRFGRARQFVFDMRITDAVRADIMAASAMVELCAS